MKTLLTLYQRHHLPLIPAYKVELIVALKSDVLRFVFELQKDQLLQKEERMEAASDIEWGKRVELLGPFP